MTSQPWQTTIARWGDPLFRLALLLLNDPDDAERASVAAFTHVLPTLPPGTARAHTAAEAADVETALYTHLLRQPPPRRLRLPARLRWSGSFRRRTLARLPSPLRRAAPLDRALLGLWLLRDISGQRLLAIAGLSADELLDRIGAALWPLLEADAEAPAEETGFREWLRHALDLAPSPLRIASDAQWAAQDAWQTILDQLRVQLRTLLESQRLPRGAAETIESALLTARGAATWWERPGVWVGGAVGGVALLMLLLLAPWPRLTPSGATPATPARADEIVQQALDVWTTQPVSGTIQRTVWALPPRGTLPAAARGITRESDAPHVTDVWQTADGARYRVEVRSENALLEWQIGDGEDTLLHAANPVRSACVWVDTGALDRAIRRFASPPEEQREVLKARLMQGAYGEGYHALRAALAADDLHSFGTRAEGQSLLLALGFTDRRTTPARQLLLWIDGATHELRAVQELPPGAASGKARDLWRLQQRKLVPNGVPTTRPQWPGPELERDTIFDPACPALDPSHVVSLRTLALTNGWWSQVYVPRELPPGITRGALISPSIVTGLPGAPPETRTILVGPDRWAAIENTNQQINMTGGETRGQWVVQIDDLDRVLRAQLCLRPEGTTYCLQSLSLRARGWTRDELLALVDLLEQVSASNWSTLDRVFLDPAPLAPEVKAVLDRALAATRPRPDSRLYIAGERSIRVPPAGPARSDPYYVPDNELRPPRLSQQQWRIYEDGKLSRFSELRMLPDGKLAYAAMSDGTWYSAYYRAGGEAQIEPTAIGRGWRAVPLTPAEEMLSGVLSTTNPITLSEQADGWLLEHAADTNGSNFFIGDGGGWLGGLPSYGFVNRLWIDRSTGLPRRAEAVSQALPGDEMLISRLDLTQWRELDAPPPDDTFRLPPLPPGTLVIRQQPNGQVQIVEPAPGFDPPPSALIWPASSGAVVRSDSDPVPLGDPASAAAAMRIQGVRFGHLDEIERQQLIKVTSYQLPSNDVPVLVRQGAPDLLRRSLRYYLETNTSEARIIQGSSPIPVTIAGQQRTAWLLDSLLDPLLVVEVDLPPAARAGSGPAQTLLIFSGPSADYLRGQLVPELAKMTWAEGSGVRDQGSGGSGVQGAGSGDQGLEQSNS